MRDPDPMKSYKEAAPTTPTAQPLRSTTLRSSLRLLGLLVAVALMGGCAPEEKPTNSGALKITQFVDPVQPQILAESLRLRAARGETIAFAFTFNPLPRPQDKSVPSLQFTPPVGGGATIAPENYAVSQVIWLNVDTNRAGFVRHTGAPASTRRLPRALYPLPLSGSTLSLSALRHPEAPQQPLPPDGPAPTLWVDLRIPPAQPAGTYTARVELLQERKVVAWIDLTIDIDDFLLADDRHLLMAGQLPWASLRRLFPTEFANIEPHLLSRGDPRHAPAVAILDELVKLAQSHRSQVYLPQVHPIVKFPAGQPPQIDWSDFDALIGPWMRGESFADGVGLGYWPIPPFDGIELHAARTQERYWQSAAEHFDAQDWLPRSVVQFTQRGAGRIDLQESIELSRRAAALLAAHPRLRVSLPCEEEHVQLASLSNPRLIPQDSLDRVMYCAPALVSSPPMQRLPAGAGMRQLRADIPGLIPYVGAGADEREVRLMAFLAFLRDARLVEWGDVLPQQSSPEEPAAVEDLIFFYPGQWFGLSKPVPSIHLKWLARAQQDYEYLYVVNQRKQTATAQVISRLLTKPVEMVPGQLVDPVDSLLSGTSDADAWSKALHLLARTVMLAQPGAAVDETERQRLAIDLRTWTDAIEKPLVLARATEWTYSRENGRGVAGLKLALDIYNATDRQPENNRLSWSSVPEGWRVDTLPVEVPKLGTYQVHRHSLTARLELDQLTAESRKPVKITYVDGYSGTAQTRLAMIPAAWCERRNGAAPKIDGSLGDWVRDDALHEGPLVQMLSRPIVQRHEMRQAARPASVYSTWTPAGLYVGFRVEGVEGSRPGFASNFIDYDLRRAWAEDIVELLVQGVFEDNTTGPLVHLALKPQGSVELSRKLNPKLTAMPWQPVAGILVPYAATLERGIWRGELALSWDALMDPANPRAKRPVLLRFNFVQHRGLRAESASWAGPIDFGRDEAFMGLLQVREP